MNAVNRSMVVALVAASVLCGQAEVHLKNGAIVKGNVTEDDGKTVKVALIAEGATGAVGNYTYDQLAPQTIFRLRFNKTERDDVKAQMDLASYALDNAVFPSARLSYDLAKKANEAKKAGMEKELEQLYARAPVVGLETAKKLIEEKEHIKAEKILARIIELFPDREEAVTAARLLEEVAPHTGSKRQEDLDKKPGGSSKSAKEAAAPARKQYEKARETWRKALQEKNSTQGTRQLEEAVDQFRAAQKLLDGAMKKEGADTDLAGHYEAWSETVKEAMISTYVDIANSYFARQSLQNALKAAESALLLDRTSSEALMTKSLIMVAMSDTDRWRW